MESNKVNVLGWYDHGNIGDEAYKLAFPKLFPQYSFNFIEKLTEPTDFCVLGGGDVVGGYFLEQIKNAKRKICLSTTINEKQTTEELKQFDQLFVREYVSNTYTKSHGVDSTYIPDLTFCLEPNKENGKQMIKNMFTKNKLDLYNRTVGIVVNANLAPGNSTYGRDDTRFEQFCYDLADVLDNYNASFVFIPFSNKMPHDDRTSNAMVASKCKFWKKNHVIFDELSVQDTLDIVSACDIMISTRLHSSIFSCISATPFVDILHNHKNQSFLDAIMYPSCIQYKDFNKRQLVLSLDHVGIEQKDTHIQMLTGITAEHRSILNKVIKNVHLL